MSDCLVTQKQTPNRTELEQKPGKQTYPEEDLLHIQKLSRTEMVWETGMGYLRQLHSQYLRVP